MIITAGKFKGRNITAPPENITRPTLSKVRMSVFNTLQAIVEFEGKSFLDMYAGSGIMGLEALSRGFSNITSIEKNPKAASIIKSNFKKFNYIPSPLVGEGVRRTGEGKKKKRSYKRPLFLYLIYLTLHLKLQRPVILYLR